MKVSIIGVGEIGTALAHILHGQKEVEVTCWDKNASKLPNQITLEASLADADLVFLCVPSWNLRGAIMSIEPHLKPTAGVVSLAKGVERESHKTVDQILAEQIPNHTFGILGGPMIAEEMLAHKVTSGVLASSSKNLRLLVKRVFKHSALRIHSSTDVSGTAVCGVLKNTYTLSIGLAEGLGLGENAKGVLFSQALKEMQVVVKLLGGKKTTVFGLAGAGDFFATSQSPHSRNRVVGITLATGADGHLESEGYVSLSCLKTLVLSTSAKLPLLETLIKIGSDGANPALLSQVIFDKG